MEFQVECDVRVEEEEQGEPGGTVLGLLTVLPEVWNQ